MESPKRKFQKQQDYQRHKLFRKIKRRRKAEAQADKEVAEKQLKKKLKLPKYDGGKTREVYTKDISLDGTGGGYDRYGGRFDFVELPEVEVKAQKIPTFKDIEEQIGRKITQDEIDKVIAVDPRIPIELPNVPTEKGLVAPSVGNMLANLVFGTAGEVANGLASATGLPQVAPNEQLVETQDGDALLDLLSFATPARAAGPVSKASSALWSKADKELADKVFSVGKKLSAGDILALERPRAVLRMPASDAGLSTAADITGEALGLRQIARKNSQIVDEAGNINMRNLAKARQQLRQMYPNARDPKTIFNDDFLTSNRTNLDQHISAVTKTAQDIPVPTGYTRQDLVQAALGHDIGKVIDPAQGVHEQISADMLTNAMREGIIGVQDIKPDVIDAIAKHGEGKRAWELDPLTQALHVADVTRGATYDQAAIHAGYLFRYPRTYPEWKFPNKSLHDELVQNINPALSRQGYETISLKSTLEDAEKALDSTIDQHRTFVRGVSDGRNRPATADMLTNTMSVKAESISGGGRRGISRFRSLYGFPKSKYDGLYLSTNANFLSAYGNNGIGGKVGVVRIPQNEASKTSSSLSERLLAGDFDVYNSSNVMRGRAGNPQSSWSLFGLPYRLQTGRSLRSDMVKMDPNVPKISYSYVKSRNAVPSWATPGDISKYYYGDPGHTTYGQVVDRINKTLVKNGLTKIKTFAKLGDDGEVDYLFYNNASGINDLLDMTNALEKARELGQKVAPYIKQTQKLRDEYFQLQREVQNPYEAWSPEWGNFEPDPEKVKRMEALEAIFSAIDDFHYTADVLNKYNALSDKQLRAFKHTGDMKYVEKPVLKASLDKYFEQIKKQKGHYGVNPHEYNQYLNNPENQAAFMRSQGVLPRYDHPTYNHTFAITPGQHPEDMPKKMATKNQPLGASQIAVIGKREAPVVDLIKELTPEEIKSISKQSRDSKLSKPKKTRRYKDHGDRIQGLKVSRKTLQ